MTNYIRNMKKMRGYDEVMKVKSSEKFEMSSNFMLTQESTSTNEEQMESNSSRGICSCIVDISIPDIFEEEMEEESVCFNCHRNTIVF